MGRRSHLTQTRRDRVVEVASGPDGHARAVCPACRRWRHEVTRVWDADRPRVATVLLNPSTTDAVRADPTMRRCLGFVRAWDGVHVLRLTAGGHPSHRLYLSASRTPQRWDC